MALETVKQRTIQGTNLTLQRGETDKSGKQYEYFIVQGGEGETREVNTDKEYYTRKEAESDFDKIVRRAQAQADNQGKSSRSKRDKLRSKATSVGKSVAGTFQSGAAKATSDVKSAASATGKKAKQAGKKAKRKASSSEDKATISQTGDQWIVIKADGSSIGPYDERFKAASKARELNREEDTQEATGRFQQFASSFAMGVNDTVDSVAGESDADADDGGGSDMMEALMGGGMDSDDGDGPTLPGFGGGEAEDNDGGPMLPGFDGGQQDGDAPQLPGFGDMDGQDGGAGPALPGFGMQEDDREDDSDQPWMF